MIDASADSGSSAAVAGELRRLDAALAERGLARSRSHAAALIADGLVFVDERPVTKASAKVAPSQSLRVEGADHYVSRAAHKLLAALDGFDIDPAGRVALDVGASTGGFTQVLLERGAREVIALDVGHGQLAGPIRADSRVTVIEGFNARELSRDNLAEVVQDSASRASGSPASQPFELPTLVVGDLSFISLTLVLPALVATCGPDADYVLLIKPQFEVGRGGVREGIVRDAGLRREAISTVLWAAHDAGLATAGLVPSPIAGGSGNREYLAWFNRVHGALPTEWDERIEAML
ncbi:TlyA family RNA methyltransferase [Ruicaihuangia caeni]|uniref:TlyA family RNA methyltransferase n=1 Tax=Ruicaihuangia caeni TaxID=3042517 RepID=A0AAW6TB87_9MICO|nr:TlyA family RNA methyltransferase [Klugiella sp. YN-L-19]MDI2098342.1 TlyA family RNA methyltransferase [Klugiella sp. YN-L-19]